MPDKVQILPAVFTPMYDDGAVRYEQIETLYRHCRELGFKGVFLNGTTGECMSLNAGERMRVVEAWLECRKKANAGKFKIIVHVGSSNLMEAASLAAHAQTHGVDGIAMVPTFYFRPKTIGEVIEQCRYVANAAREVPFYYYNIPSLTGVHISLTTFLESAIKSIPTFAGLKNSSNDLSDHQQCLHMAKNDYAMYWGTDEVFIMAYAAGNRHYVGSTYNFMAGMYEQMLDAYHECNFSRLNKLQEEATRIYRILNDNHSLIAGKAVMQYIGVDCGPVRRPLKKLGVVEHRALRERLESTAFFSFSSREKTVKIG